MKTRKAYLTYITSLLLYGLNGVVASHITMSSYEIVFLRMLIGSVLLIGLFLLLGNRFTFYQKPKDTLFLAASGIGMGVSGLFVYEAYQQIGVSLSSLLYYCGPVLVMILSPVLFREKLTWPKIVGFAAVLCGIFLVNGQIFGETSSLWGLFCGVMSAVTLAVMIICNKKAKGITGMENPTLQLLFGFCTVAVFFLCKQGISMEIPAQSIPWILMIGAVNTGLGGFLYFSSIGKLPVQTVAICGYLEPLSAVVFSVLLLHEVMLPLQILGAALIIGGALFGECFQSLRKKTWDENEQQEEQV